jgi:predicted site-specific integrase-resolvase
MDILKMEALVYFYQEMPKNAICNKLKINSRTLNRWIKNDTTTIREMALNMLYFKTKKSEICYFLRINKHVLEKWIRESNEKIAAHALKKEVTQGRQNGRSYWLDKI